MVGFSSTTIFLVLTSTHPCIRYDTRMQCSRFFLLSILVDSRSFLHGPRVRENRPSRSASPREPSFTLIFIHLQICLLNSALETLLYSRATSSRTESDVGNAVVLFIYFIFIPFIVQAQKSARFACLIFLTGLRQAKVVHADACFTYNYLYSMFKTGGSKVFDDSS